MGLRLICRHPQIPRTHPLSAKLRVNSLLNQWKGKGGLCQTPLHRVGWQLATGICRSSIGGEKPSVSKTIESGKSDLSLRLYGQC